MKKYCLGFLFFFFSYSLSFGQVDMFRGNANADPERYGKELLFYMTKADNLMLQGQFEKAITVYDNVIAKAPEFAEGYIKRAMAKYKIRRMTEAQQDYQMAIRLNPYIGDLYGYNNDMSKLNILAFDPMQFLAEPSIEYRLEYYKSTFDTVFEYDSLKETEPMIYQDYWQQKGILFLERGEFRLALETFKTIETTGIPMNFDLIGLTYTQLEDSMRARIYFEKAIENDPDFELSYLNLSLLEAEQGHIQTALDLVNKAIELNPKLLKAYFYRAMLYKRQGRNEAALSEFNEVESEVQSPSYELYLNRAITKKMSGDALGALTDINAAIEINTSNSVLFKIRGNIQILLKNYAAAVDDFNRAIDLNSEFAEAYFNRGIANLLSQNRTDACADLERSIELGYIQAEQRLSYFCSF